MSQPTDPTIVSSTESSSTTDKPARVVARAGRYYRNTRYVMFILILGFGIACIYDGWVRWPRQNIELQQADADLALAQQKQDQAGIDRNSAIRAKLKHHTEMDLNIQKGLGIVLPPLAVILLIRAVYLSRGQYRLEDEVLYLPGHPPIPLSAITQVDRRLWDRKGILYVDYQLPDGKAGKAKMDDFIYNRKATDAIAERIKEPGQEMKAQT